MSNPSRKRHTASRRDVPPRAAPFAGHVHDWDYTRVRYKTIAEFNLPDDWQMASLTLAIDP